MVCPSPVGSAIQHAGEAFTTGNRLLDQRLLASSDIADATGERLTSQRYRCERAYSKENKSEEEWAERANMSITAKSSTDSLPMTAS
jgi:hypothetical protein